MKITIKIPQNIVDACVERGWDLQEIQKHFTNFMYAIIDNPYSHFEIDFFNWLENLEEEE